MYKHDRDWDGVIERKYHSDVVNLRCVIHSFLVYIFLCFVIAIILM